MKKAVQRIFYMDALRATLMMLGVVLHAAQVFNYEKTWIIYSDRVSHVMTYIVQCIHLFRMPAFFVVSGFFCYLTLERYGPKKFLNLRLPKIVVPLLVVFLTLNPLQEFLLKTNGWSQNDSIVEYLSSGSAISHLWFLINLLFYFSFSAVIFYFFEKIRARIRIENVNFLEKDPIFWIFITSLPLLTIAILAIGKLGFPLYSSFYGVVNVFSIFKYAPYFTVGVILGINIEYLKKFSSQSPLLIISLLSVSLIITSFFSDSNDLFSEIISTYFKTMSVWASIMICFYVFFRLCNANSSIWRFLSEASYSVYLFHHCLVVVAAVLLVNLSVEPHIGFLITVSTVLLSTLAIHKYLISPSALLSFLFNGVRK